MMARNARSAESPMDFEWTSPHKSTLSFDSSFSKSLNNAFDTPTKKRPLNATDSPPKQLNTASKQFGNIAPVSNGDGGSFLFSSTPTTFNRNKFSSDFFTPRNTSPTVVNSDIDVSSAGESPLPDDSPDVPPRRPSQYEKIRGTRKYQDAVRKKRIQKPRRAYITGSPTKYDTESEDDSVQNPQTDMFAIANTNANNNQKSSIWTSDPDLPYVASGYVQLVFNMFLVGVALYIGLAFIRTIQRDVDLKVEEYSAEILQEMAVCSKEYLENRCAPNTRVPAMEKACLAWEKCMNRDPTVVGRARVSAETFAEIINSFIEPISYKTMIFCLLAVFGSVFLSNFAFGLLRQREHSQRFLPYPQAPPPQTPVQIPNLVMMSPWNGNAPMASPQRIGSPRRKTSGKRDGGGE